MKQFSTWNFKAPSD